MKERQRKVIEDMLVEVDGDVEIIARILLGIEASLQVFVDEFEADRAEREAHGPA